MLDEVEEYAHAVETLRHKLKRHKAGSAAYHDLLPDLAVQLDVLRLKVEYAAQALEEYEEITPRGGLAVMGQETRILFSFCTGHCRGDLRGRSVQAQGLPPQGISRAGALG